MSEYIYIYIYLIPRLTNSYYSCSSLPRSISYLTVLQTRISRNNEEIMTIAVNQAELEYISIFFLARKNIIKK